MPAARQSLELARHSGAADQIVVALNNALRVAADVPWPEAIAAVGQTLDQIGGVPEGNFGFGFLDRILAATARGDDWASTVALLERHSAITRRRDWWTFGAAGKVWGRMARPAGRAETYRRIANALPWIEKIIVMLPLLGGPDSAAATHTADR